MYTDFVVYQISQKSHQFIKCQPLKAANFEEVTDLRFQNMRILRASFH